MLRLKGTRRVFRLPLATLLQRAMFDEAESQRLRRTIKRGTFNFATGGAR